MLTISLVVAIIIVHWLLSAGFLWMAARWVKAERIRFARALMATTLIWIVSVGGTLATFQLRGQVEKFGEPGLLIAAAAALLIQVLIIVQIIHFTLATTWLRAFGAWLISLIPSVAATAFVLLVVRVYLLEAFYLPTNSMAPTLIGWHRTTACPHCGQTMIVAARPAEEEKNFPDPEPPGICTQCLKTSKFPKLDGEVLPGDRFISNKLLTPKRWDLVVFRPPFDQKTKYVMRLVGLPGETIFIKDGAVWINGVKAELPPEIAAVQFSTDAGYGEMIPFGSQDKPLVLQNNEYCVLGDFSLRSSDSRYWGPVPGNNLEGVADVLYWPMSRWKLLR
jgi:signal peptidase I